MEYSLHLLYLGIILHEDSRILEGEVEPSKAPVQAKGYVDDFTQSQRGTERDILAALVPAALHLTRQLRSLGRATST
eukprot:6449432-Pyramimonas_sp.AAC.1